jgi:hypothetical protein
MATEPALAYVRTVTSVGVPVWWRNPCVTMDFLLGSPPPDMTGDDYLQAARSAASTWSHPALACSGLAISIQKTADTTADVALDGRNFIVMRQNSWCDDTTSTDPSEPATCYPTNALAITTVFRNTSTGEIVQADTEVNAVNVFWADLVKNPSLASGSTADFQNMITHELGHVIGLAHPCFSAADTTRLDDNLGQPQLDCTDPDLPATVADATMFPSVLMANTSRRMLTPDDEQAACDIYPSSVTTCPSGESSGCAVAPSSSRSPGRGPPVAASIALGLLAFLAASGLRRR